MTKTEAIKKMEEVIADYSLQERKMSQKEMDRIYSIHANCENGIPDEPEDIDPENQVPDDVVDNRIFIRYIIRYLKTKEQK